MGYLDRIKQRLFEPLLQRRARARIARQFDRPPVILGGCPRSGTTLLLAMLAAHPGVHAIASETKAFVLWARRRDAPGRYEPARLRRLYRALALSKIEPSARRWCEKTPANVQHFEKLADYFPGARLIHIVRDGLDVVTSTHALNPRGYFVEPAEWVHHTRAGLRAGRTCGALTVKYEDLVSRFEAEIAGICSYLGEPVVERLARWYEFTPIRRDRAWHHEAIAQHEASIGRWRRSEHAARVAEFGAHEEAVTLRRELGYLA